MLVIKGIKQYPPKFTSLRTKFGKKSFCSTATEIPDYLTQLPPTQITTLPNGFRVATQECATDTATVGVFIDSGSAYETESDNGVAHFLEHLSFKGTQKRTQKQLELEIENMGAQLNAYTSREQTVFYSRVFKDDVGKAVDIISDIVQNSTLSESAIERERSTILREASEIEGNVEETLYDHLHAIAFQGTGLGRTILGTENNIKTLTRADLQRYIATHYTAPRMVLAAAGGIKHERVVELAQQQFGKVPTTSNTPREVPFTRYTGSMVTIPDYDLPLIHMLLGFKSLPWTDPNYWVMAVIQAILGNWDITAGAGKHASSRLVERVSDGLAHSVTTFHTPYKRTGLFGLYVTSDQQNLADLSYVLLNELGRVAKGATEDEVERAKKRVLSSVLMQLDATHQICEDIGRQVLSIGKRQSLAEVYARISSIDANLVKEVADSIFYDVDPAVVAMGPIGHSVPDYNHFRTWTTWKTW